MGVDGGQGGDGAPSLDHEVSLLSVRLVTQSVTPGGALQSLWVWNFNYLIFYHSRQADTLGRLDFHHGVQVGQETLEAELDRAVQVEKILHREIADVEGKNVMTEPLKKLNVAQTVRHAGGVSQRYLAPHQIVRTVEGDEGRETDSVGEVGEVLQFVQLGKEGFIAVVDLGLLQRFAQNLTRLIDPEQQGLLGLGWDLH